MKEHFQDFGVRKWAGDDLIELQAEPLAALQTLVAPYAPCILQGCEMETVSDGSGGTTYRLHAGLAALKGVDAAGNPCVKIVRVEEEPWTSDTVYLSLKCEQKSRTYADGNNKVIANEYKAALSATQSDDALTISATDGAPRLVDKLGITQKLNIVGGNARDVVVTFVESMEDNRPELKSGSSLGLLLQQIRKWFDELKDLKALAFKAKVAMTDLTEEFAQELAEELDGKAPSVHSHEVATASSKGFMSSDDKEKLDGIPKDANNFTYTHPALNHIPSAGSSGQYLKYYSSGTAQWVSPANNTATTAASGFMSASDKIKLDGIATGATKVIVDSSLNSLSTNPVQNRTVSSALAGKAPSDHEHSWESITNKPTSFKPETHYHTPNSLGVPTLIGAVSVTSTSKVVNLKGNIGLEYVSPGTYKAYMGLVNCVMLVMPVGDCIVHTYKSGQEVYVALRNTSNTPVNLDFFCMCLGL